MTKTVLARDERIAALTERDGPNCFHPDCGLPFAAKEDITFDHWWVPQSQGGTWDLWNLRMMHKRCNAIKGDRIPNSDGSLPPLKRESRAEHKAIAKSERPEICAKCNAGRALGPEEICDLCGSLPQPYTFPRWAQMRPKECSHSGPWHCWMCTLGFIEREAAIITVLDGNYVDE